MPFLMGTIPQVKRLADAFRKAGRPGVLHRARPEARLFRRAFPYWRCDARLSSDNRTFIAEGTWGAQVIDELSAAGGRASVVKKGFGGFANTPLDTILRNMA